MSFGSPGIGEGGSCFQLRSTAWICGFSLWGTGVGSDGAIGGFVEADGVKGCGSGGYFGGHFVFDSDELCRALADIPGQCLCLGLASCLFGEGAAGSGVGDREVLFDVEARVVGILNGIDDPALGCADGSGAFTGKPTRLAQMLGYATDYL